MFSYAINLGVDERYIRLFAAIATMDDRLRAVSTIQLAGKLFHMIR